MNGDNDGQNEPRFQQGQPFRSDRVSARAIDNSVLNSVFKNYAAAIDAGHATLSGSTAVFDGFLANTDRVVLTREVLDELKEWRDLAVVNNPSEFAVIEAFNEWQGQNEDKIDTPRMGIARTKHNGEVSIEAWAGLNRSDYDIEILGSVPNLSD